MPLILVPLIRALLILVPLIRALLILVPLIVVGPPWLLAARAETAAPSGPPADTAEDTADDGAIVWLPPAHGLAIHGEPLYPAGFSHLDYVNPQAPVGGTLRVAAVGTFDSLNATIVAGNKGAGLIYLDDTLMVRTWNEPFTVYGLIAERAQLAADRSAIRFFLNPAARFHDGTAITAADVAWSFETRLAHGPPQVRRVYGLVERVEIEDPHIIAFHLKAGEANREVPLILAMMPVLPRHWWQASDTAGRPRDITQPTLELPLGSGPYRLVEAEAGRRLVWERVPEYWARDLPVRRGLHNLGTLVYDYYRDGEVALQAFLAGATGLHQETDPARWAVAYSAAEGNPQIRRQAFDHQRPDQARFLIFNQRRPPFDDVRVREALAGLLDFAFVRDSLFHGLVERVDSLFPNSELAARAPPAAAERALLEPFAQDLDPRILAEPFQPRDAGGGAAATRAALRAAVEHLAGAGWSIQGGVMTGPQGQPLAFEILMPAASDTRIPLLYAAMLERIGVTARLREMDSASFTTRLRVFDFDTVMFRWISTLSPGNEQAHYFGSAAAETEGTRNYAGIRLPVVDTLIQAISDAPDRDSLVAATRALDRVLMYQFLGVPLYFTGRDFWAWWAPLQGPAVTPLYGPVLEAWWIAADAGPSPAAGVALPQP